MHFNCGSELARESVSPNNALLTESQPKKSPDASRDRIGAEGTVEELPSEGDQTFVLQAEFSVPTPLSGKLVENDLFIAVAATATNRPCRAPAWLPESSHDLRYRRRMRVMMYADLIDQEDLLGQLKALGIQVPSGTTADQACECAVRGLDNVRAFELRKMVKDMYTSGASIQPAVRQAIDKQLLPALADFQQSHSA
jgi:hypothetical protein